MMGKGCFPLVRCQPGEVVHLEQFWFHIKLPETEQWWQQNQWRTTRCSEAAAGIRRSKSLDLCSEAPEACLQGPWRILQDGGDLLHPGGIVLAYSNPLCWPSGTEETLGTQVEDPAFRVCQHRLSRGNYYLPLCCVHKSNSNLVLGVWMAVLALWAYFNHR